MPRTYTVEFDAQASAVQVDFFEITPADDKPIAIIGYDLGQSSDVGDAADEVIRFRVIRGHATSGSGGAAATPRPLEPSDVAAGFAAETVNTTIASTGTPVNLHSGAFNVRAGTGLVLMPPEAWWRCSQGQTSIVVRLAAAPVDSLTYTGTLYVVEFG